MVFKLNQEQLGDYLSALVCDSVAEFPQTLKTSELTSHM